MAKNSLSPGFVKMYYGRGGSQHVHTIPIKFHDAPVAGSDPLLLKHDASGTNFGFLVEEYADLFKALFAATETIDHAEVWSQPTPDDDPVWIFSDAISVAGTNGVATSVGSEAVMTFRTASGGLYRWYCMEPSLPPNQVYSPATFPAAYAAISDYLIGGDSWVYGRDNGKVAVPLSMKTKTNDVLRRLLLTG